MPFRFKLSLVVNLLTTLLSTIPVVVVSLVDVDVTVFGNNNGGVCVGKRFGVWSAFTSNTFIGTPLLVVVYTV